jgi:predicted phosphodiesterase
MPAAAISRGRQNGADRSVKVAIISDIHGNLQALEAVLGAIGASSAEEIWCLGDLVGYGANPNECVALVREHASLCLAGNHDLAVIDAIPISDFSPLAAAAIRWTRSMISEQSRAYLASLLPSGRNGEVGLFHASPRDAVWEYVLSPALAELCMDVQPTRLSLIGHSHIALSFSRLDGAGAAGRPRPAGSTLAVEAGEWLLNPGSVGQPRDGDPRAAWMLIDTERWHVSFERAAYEIAPAAGAIRAAGLPEALADRLELGQ